jgi:hypothetical protein
MIKTTVLALAVLSTATTVQQPPPPIPAESALEQAERLELQGRLSEALKILARAQPQTQAVKDHARVAAELNKLIVHLDLIEHRPRRALAELQRIQFDHSAYHGLARVLDRAVDRENRQLWLEADSAATAMVDNGDFDAAIELYAALRRDTALSLSTTREAAQKIGEVRKRKAKETEGWLAKTQTEAKNAGAAMLTYIAALLIVGGLLWLVFTGVGFWTKKGSVLDVKDLTAGEHQGEFAAQTLAADIQSEVLALTNATNGYTVDDAADVDGFAGLRAATPPLGRLDQVVSDVDAIKVAGVSFSPRDLLALFATAFRRPYESTLRGHLALNGNTYVVQIERTDLPQRFKDVLRVVLRRRRKNHQTRFRGSGETRKEAIREFARRYAFEYGEYGCSDKWESFNEYAQALQLLFDPESPETLARARDLLESSIRHDPHNYHARFKYAELLRKVNRTEEALEQFNYLKARIELIDGDVVPGFSTLKPDLLFILDYNRAVTMTGLARDCQVDAIKILEQLDKEFTKDEPAFHNIEIATSRQALAPAGS